MKKLPLKVAHNWPPSFFFSTGPTAQTAQNQKSCTPKSPLLQDWVFRLGFRISIISRQFHTIVPGLSAIVWDPRLLYIYIFKWVAYFIKVLVKNCQMYLLIYASINPLYNITLHSKFALLICQIYMGLFRTKKIYCFDFDVQSRKHVLNS